MSCQVSQKKVIQNKICVKYPYIIGLSTHYAISLNYLRRTEKTTKSKCVLDINAVVHILIADDPFGRGHIVQLKHFINGITYRNQT